MSIVGRVFPRLQLQSIKDLATLDLVLLVCDQPLSGSTVLRVSLGGRSVLYPHHGPLLVLGPFRPSFASATVA